MYLIEDDICLFVFFKDVAIKLIDWINKFRLQVDLERRF